MKLFFLVLCLLIGVIAGMITLAGLPDFIEVEMDDTYYGDFVTIKEDKIRIVQKGEGPDILLIHGKPGILDDWEYFFNVLSKDYRVTSFDRPGYGFSSFHYNSSPLKYNMEIVSGLINKLSLRNVIVVGHSYGSLIALALAVENTAPVRGYILLSPETYPKGGFTFFNRIARYPVPGRGFFRIIKGFILPPAIKADLEMAFNPDTLPDDYYKERINLFLQTKTLISMAREESYLKSEADPVKALYKDITKPVLIIYGKNDKVIPVYIAQELKKRITGSKLVILKDTGHMVQYREPEELKNQIDAFF